eukprot:TRINITY_DN50_c0_g1_i9.p1 TRINITY_DN50_c0_g1~~TRINITY_DN50_c0_g1_i9.p1  ORF type:complete len:771 (+),score=162.79 TRINITY_DN50_c0_g1_i9:95-2314(+)
MFNTRLCLVALLAASSAAQELTLMSDSLITGSTTSMAVSNNYLYTVTDYLVKIINIADKGDPVTVKTLPGPAYTNSLLVSGNRLYVSTVPKLIMYDLSNPEDPVEIGVFSPPKTASSGWRSLSQDNEHIYITCKEKQYHLYVLEKGTLRVLGSTTSDNPFNALAYDDGKIYASRSLNNQGDPSGISVTDVSDPANPIETHYFQIPYLYTNRVAFHNGYIYVSRQEGSSEKKLLKLDASTGVPEVLNLPATVRGCSDIRFHNSRVYAMCTSRLFVLYEETPNTFITLDMDYASSYTIVISGEYLYAGDDRVFRLPLGPVVLSPAPTPAPTPLPTPVPTPLPTPVPTPTPVLEGCFDDSVTERKLPHLAYTDTNGLTNGECATICQSRGYKYSGTQDGSQCWCGDDISTSARVDPAKCSTACSGDSAQKCGGYLRGTVYRVVPMVPPHTPVLEGCFKDGRTRRLSHHAFSSPLNTVWECTRTCQHNGYKYAGLQYGKQCWCGDDLSTSTRTVMSQCDDPCSGDSTQTCGGGWRNQVYSLSPVAPSGPVNYMGCFRDYSSNRQFPVYAYSDSKLNSVEKCTRTCQHNGYKYAGLQYGKQCWCGDDLSTSTRTTMSQCDDPCSGDSTQTCGGGYRNQVYSLVPVAPRESFRYAGCYRDYQSSRQFPVYAYSDRNGNNVEECTRTCQHNGYAVAGLQNGNQCWCGNDLGSRKSLPEYLCRTPCPGDTSVTCGAPWYNSVWATLK